MARKIDELTARLDRMWSEASEERKKYDFKWFLYGLWTRGYHYARYDTRTRQIVGEAPKDGRPKVVINKIYPTLRSVRNYALRNKPKAEVIPENLTDQNLDQAQKATQFLDFIHETQSLRYKLKGTVWQALENSVGWWQVLWNGDNIEVNPVDVFDFYPDPKATSPDQMRYGILAIRKRIADLMEDEKYDKKKLEEIKPDNLVSSSSYKDMLASYDRDGVSSASANKSDKSGTVILKEYWYKEDGKIYVTAMAGDQIIRKPEIVDTKIIPFFRLASDIMPFQMYGEGWVKNMIDPQKLLNSAMSSVAEYNVLMNKVKVITDKGAGVRVYNNKHGQIIEKRRGYEVTTKAIAPLNSAIFEQISLSEKFIEDIGAMHDATIGRVPTGAKSGKAIENLQLGDSNNMSELTENIENFLEDVYEYILWLASQKYQEMKNVIATDYTGQKDFIKVIGESSPVAQQMLEAGNIPEDVYIASEKNMVRVKITSYLSHTPEAKRESIKELYALLPELPEDILLDGFGVGNIADVIKRIKEKRAEEAQQTMMQQRSEMEMQKEVQGPPEAGSQEAVAVIRSIINGQPPQVPANVGQSFIQAIDQFLARENELGQLDQETLSAIQTFRDQVVQGAGRQPA